MFQNAGDSELSAQRRALPETPQSARLCDEINKRCCSEIICCTRSNFSLRFLSVSAVACPRINPSISPSQVVAGVFWLGFH